MKKRYYWSLEDNEGHIRFTAPSLRIAKHIVNKYAGTPSVSNEGICKKRKLDDPTYEKMEFIW